MTTYQKLKKRNAELQNELITLCNNINSNESKMIILKYKTLAAAEYAIWYGNMYEETNFNGLLNKVK